MCSVNNLLTNALGSKPIFTKSLFINIFFSFFDLLNKVFLFLNLVLTPYLFHQLLFETICSQKFYFQPHLTHHHCHTRLCRHHNTFCKFLQHFLQFAPFFWFCWFNIFKFNKSLIKVLHYSVLRTYWHVFKFINPFVKLKKGVVTIIIEITLTLCNTFKPIFFTCFIEWHTQWRILKFSVFKFTRFWFVL